MDVSLLFLYNLFDKKLSFNLNYRPDTFVYTTADQTGFLLPQVGAYFVVSSKGKHFIYWLNWLI